ncbi:hypothetical protein CLI75_11830, partial [Porphyromonas gingivalis]
DVDWVAKVKMQGRIQQWVDHSISVTINLPSDVTEELVNTLYVGAMVRQAILRRPYCFISSYSHGSASRIRAIKGLFSSRLASN